MTFLALLSGFITVVAVVTIGWAFYRKPLSFIPSTIFGALFASVLVGVVQTIFIEVLNPENTFTDAAVFTNAAGVLIGIIIANSLWRHKQPK